MSRKSPKKAIQKYGYYGAVINDAFINGAKGEPSSLFENLSSEEKEIWDKFAKDQGLETIKFYNEFGHQIVLSQLQTFLIMKLQEKYNQQIENNSDWKKSDWMMDKTGDYGIVYTSCGELAHEIYGERYRGRLADIQNAVIGMANSRGFLAYYVRNPKNGKPILRVEKCSLITYGLDIYDKRQKTLSWIRLHPAFFGVVRDRYIRCRDHTELMSEFFDYKIPSMATMILVRFLMKFGTLADFHVEIGATKLMKMLCSMELKHRRTKRFTMIATQACEACKHVGIILSYDDTQKGICGEKKYIFELNPSFFRKESKN